MYVPVRCPPANARRPRRATACVAAALTALIAGCPPPPPMTPPPPRETSEVVGAVNRNRAGFSSPIYSPDVSVSGVLTDSKGAAHVLDARGVMVLRWPSSVFIRLDHALERGQVWIGSNDEEYWVAIRRGYETMWWGKHKYIGRPEVEPLPIEPARVADALGMRALPVATMLGPYQIAESPYDRLIYGRPGWEGSVQTDRDYWVERTPPYLPRRINYFDRRGEIELTILLDDYRPVLERESTLFPRRIELRWPKRNSWMRMQVSGLQPRADVSPRAFERPLEPPEGIHEMTQVDRFCEIMEGADARGTDRDAPRRAPTAAPGGESTRGELEP